jgi:hypothetical protein
MDDLARPPPMQVLVVLSVIVSMQIAISFKPHFYASAQQFL